MKIFGIGLARTGTTSLSVAMLMLGYKTAHTCFSKHIYDQSDALFDTPIWADYQTLDQRYPGSRFILTWRDPEEWYQSFKKNIEFHMTSLYQNDTSETDIKAQAFQIDKRAYQSVYGEHLNTDSQHIIECYKRHREQAENYFSDRPSDLLVIDLSKEINPWKNICSFLQIAEPAAKFPHSNKGQRVGDWKSIMHVNKITLNQSLPESVVQWIRQNLSLGADPRKIFDLLLEKRVPINLVKDVMGAKFPDDEPKFY